MPLVLEKELETFNQHRTELLGRAKGEYVLVKGDRIVDTFTSERDALRQGYREFGSQPFLVKKVTDFDAPLTFTSVFIGPPA